MVPKPRRSRLSSSLPWEPQMSHIKLISVIILKKITTKFKWFIHLCRGKSFLRIWQSLRYSGKTRNITKPQKNSYQPLSWSLNHSDHQSLGHWVKSCNMTFYGTAIGHSNRRTVPFHLSALIQHILSHRPHLEASVHPEDTPRLNVNWSIYVSRQNVVS